LSSADSAIGKIDASKKPTKLNKDLNKVFPSSKSLYRPSITPQQHTEHRSLTRCMENELDPSYPGEMKSWEIDLLLWLCKYSCNFATRLPQRQKGHSKLIHEAKILVYSDFSKQRLVYSHSVSLTPITAYFAHVSQIARST